MGMIRVVLGWAIAVFTTVVTGSVIQTQFNMASLTELGVEIGWGERLSATWHDLVNFTPAYALLVSIAFAIAWPIAGLLKRWLPDQRTMLFALAGFAAIWTMISIMNQALPVTGIAATRSLAGVLALSLCGAAAGWLYTRILPVSEYEANPA
ncbi:MAG: hypothetical protein CMP07_06280 [Xanthomonadales bacterium]|nr:hypothetical protein [Xanthomonadales bacterium]